MNLKDLKRIEELMLKHHKKTVKASEIKKRKEEDRILAKELDLTLASFRHIKEEMELHIFDRLESWQGTAKRLQILKDFMSAVKIKTTPLVELHPEIEEMIPWYEEQIQKLEDKIRSGKGLVGEYNERRK